MCIVHAIRRISHRHCTRQLSQLKSYFAEMIGVVNSVMNGFRTAGNFCGKLRIELISQ